MHRNRHRELIVKLPITLALVLYSINIYGQNNTVKSENRTDIWQTNLLSGNDTIELKHKVRPLYAALGSAIIPGMGQVLNKKYWKVPLLWGAGLGFNTLYNTHKNHYLTYKDQFANPNNTDGSSNITQSQIAKFRRSYELSLILLGMLYIANILDAYVDAYMLDFDVCRNLSVSCIPVISPNFSASTLSLTYWAKLFVRL